MRRKDSNLIAPQQRQVVPKDLNELAGKEGLRKSKWK